MHGIFCNFLAQYVESAYGHEFWSDLHFAAGIAPRRYKPTHSYPEEDILALLQKLAATTGRPMSEVLENLGVSFAPHLLAIYSALIRPQESTLQVLATVEEIAHRTVRLHNPDAAPPMLKCMWRTEREMELIYSSHRKLCALAKGIIRGIAMWLDETVEVTDTACMLQGDPYCGLSIVVTSQPSVQPAARRSAPMKRQHHADTMGSTRPMYSPVVRTYDWLPPPLAPDDLGTLGQYRILEALGEGGMGIVFLAHDTQLQRRVALKLLKPSLLSDPQTQATFLREARAAAALTSDHIVPIYQISEERGFPFFVMPLLKGETLRQRLARKEVMTLGRVVQVGLECAAGVTAAHAESLIHRDIKPSNIWLEAPNGRIKLVDFGLAHRLHSTAIGSGSEFLQRGWVSGTLQYMAPEQAEGDWCTPQTDLYSLGVVLYEMCALRLPLRGSSVIQMVRALALESPRPVHEFAPAVPADLESLIMQMLAKEPGQRPASAIEVANRLSAIQDRLKATSAQETVISPSA